MLNRLLFTTLTSFTAPLLLAQPSFATPSSTTNAQLKPLRGVVACDSQEPLATCIAAKSLPQHEVNLAPPVLEELAIFWVSQLSGGWSAHRLMDERGITQNTADSIALKALTLRRDTLPVEGTSAVPTVEVDPSRPFVHPAPMTQQVTSPYGWRRRPMSGSQQFHKGIDYGAPLGSPVLAAAGGTVSEVISGCPDFTSYSCGSQYGNRIEIDHGAGKVTLYAHLQRGSITVKKGDQVTRGQAIAKVGSSGWSTGAHLDFRLTVHGDFQDPAPLVAALPPQEVQVVKQP